jgi:hypothetical protein
VGISFRKYIDITSGVGAGAVVNRRELIGRLFTINPLLPTKTFAEFTEASEVSDYFGVSSEEYLRALWYFSFISKNITRPKKISFARWTNEDVAPEIYGARFTTTLSQFQAITAGAFALTLGGTTNQITGLNFSAAGSLAAVAALIEDAIQAKSGTMWTAATVTYDATRGAFNLVGGQEVAAAVAVAAPASGVDIRGAIGWTDSAIYSDGALTETITDVLTESAQASNNFGSFLFMPSLTQDELVEAAAWNSAAEQNTKFIDSCRVTSSNAAAISAALANYAGVGMTLAPLSTEYPEQMPMVTFAATDYSQRNSTQNYMYQQANLTPSVQTTVDSDTYDDLRVNYYGRTQTAGQLIDFYQRGVLTGLPVNARDMNTYANEIWLKDAAGAALMQLLLALPKISANQKGRGQILTTLQSIIDEALNNGTISVGKTLSTTQKLYISEITGDQFAWYQVQNIGYWVDCEIVLEDDEYVARYTLVYSKDDTIRKVEGTHVLI